MDIAKQNKSPRHWYYIAYIVLILIIAWYFFIPRMRTDLKRSVLNLEHYDVTPTQAVTGVPVQAKEELPLPDYGQPKTWNTFTNTRFGYSVLYPPRSSYEAKSTAEYPTAQTNKSVSFISDSYQDATRIYPWRIDITADLGKRLYDTAKNSGFKANIQAEIDRMNQVYHYGMSIVDEETVHGHAVYIISNNAAETMDLQLYAMVERSQSTFDQIFSEAVPGGNTAQFKQFFNQFVSTYTLLPQTNQ